MHLDRDPGRIALSYAARGWLVLPLWWPSVTGHCACGLPDCDGAAKHPIARLAPHGLHDATTRLRAVAAWWRSVPCANVGIRTGAPSEFVVLDVDGPAGVRALRALVAAHGPFDAAWVRTGGGWHAYFAHPGVAVPTSAGQVGDGLDVRGEASYVVAPPSLHRNRHHYRWASGRGGLPPMPEWLLHLAVPPVSAVPGRSPVRLRTGQATAYAAAAVSREADEVAHAPAGQRNHRLNRAAFCLGQLVGAGLLDETTATVALVNAGLAAGPGERKIRSTVSRGLQAGMRHLRQVLFAALS